MRKASLLAAVLLVVAVASPAAAQSPAAPSAAAQGQVTQIPVGAKVGEPAPAAGSYQSLGRRDPFVSLIATRRPTTANVMRTGSGLTSFAIADVAVTGIVRVGAGEARMAIIQNVDKQSYVAKVGSRLADGVVKSIDAAGVVFVENGDPGVTQPREVRKLLHPSEEVKR
jgi:hypothetical protein